MLKEALEFLTKAGADRACPGRVSTGMHSSVFRFVDGHEINVKDDIPPRSHEVHSPECLLATVAKYGNGVHSAIWIGVNSIIAVFDDDEYRESSARLEFTFSDTFKTLTDLSEAKQFQQKKLIKFLRRSFSEEDIKDILPAVRRVDFQRIQKSGSIRERGEETLGKSVEARVQNIDDIPETFNVLCPVLDIDGFKSPTTIRVIVDIDMDNECFELFVRPDSLRLAREDAIKRVVDHVKAHCGDCNVFTGVHGPT